MPLYEFVCDLCGFSKEKLSRIGGASPLCPTCRVGMRKKPTFPAMIKWKGEGGFPSLRKAHKGTAPYTSDYGEYEGGSIAE